MNDKDYSADYSDASFWEKLRKVARTIGREIAEKVLCMFFAARDPDTPMWAKTVLVAALGYFICPVDAIPDMIPGAGFADDMGAIVTALGAVAAHKERAREKAAEWFS